MCVKFDDFRLNWSWDWLIFQIIISEKKLNVDFQLSSFNLITHWSTIDNQITFIERFAHTRQTFLLQDSPALSRNRLWTSSHSFSPSFVNNPLHTNDKYSGATHELASPLPRHVFTCMKSSSLCLFDRRKKKINRQTWFITTTAKTERCAFIQEKKSMSPRKESSLW